MKKLFPYIHANHPILLSLWSRSRISKPLMIHGHKVWGEDYFSAEEPMTLELEITSLGANPEILEGITFYAKHKHRKILSCEDGTGYHKGIEIVPDESDIGKRYVRVVKRGEGMKVELSTGWKERKNTLHSIIYGQGNIGLLIEQKADGWRYYRTNWGFDNELRFDGVQFRIRRTDGKPLVGLYDDYEPEVVYPSEQYPEGMFL